uniref:AAA+ ATPase domain-containing protein n=1 Tax=Erythrolobus madagascarensis TaxID=708628 RepID=A0A7S0T720_9RHOD|mmetsp:Transcript_2699/g.5945  ORF Transcript_2699/g.5945 Transcript_2699/m.5945 type:complete len:567 (+) Transcript_2699:282-1982(+)|eukprot:CAMPEP_0185854340 /NCGR_PEP_ID=MMETSP1354-20130828/21990_1 /TAXON_ID=708628 /ORGANISM="Erythrolobus madagascarensis, Strain CCMP3276" /LENGTH=566 /DNA_ID=CAMNT_0028556073 /DNA_START=204 /DNA_END=1904 /DNA_ORIENTATION=-
MPISTRRSAKNDALALASYARVSKPRRRNSSTKSSALLSSERQQSPRPPPVHQKTVSEVTSVDFSTPSTPRNDKRKVALKHPLLRAAEALSLRWKCSESAESEQVLGRSKELALMRSVLEQWLSGRRDTARLMNGSLYVSGLPGCGKTFAVTSLLRSIERKNRDVITVELNCASLGRAVDKLSHGLLDAVAAALRVSGGVASCETDASESAVRSKLMDLLCEAGKPVIVVLDELDFLLALNSSSPVSSKDCPASSRKKGSAEASSSVSANSLSISRNGMSLLHALFELPNLLHTSLKRCGLSSKSGARLSIVGIANTLDLPDHLHPWLRASGSMPELVPFGPYSANALTEILSQRLWAASKLPHSCPRQNQDHQIDSVAVQLCANSVAAATGDARVALDVLRTACLEAAGARIPKDASAWSDTTGEWGESIIGHVSSILVRRGGSNAAVRAVESLPLQQQLILCCLARALSKRKQSRTSGSSTLLTIGLLHEEVSSTSRTLQLQPVRLSELVEICSTSLVHHSLIEITHRADIRKSPVSLRADLADIQDALKHHKLLSWVAAIPLF